MAAATRRLDLIPHNTQQTPSRKMYSPVGEEVEVILRRAQIGHRNQEWTAAKYEKFRNGLHEALAGARPNRPQQAQHCLARASGRGHRCRQRLPKVTAPDMESFAGASRKNFPPGKMKIRSQIPSMSWESPGLPACQNALHARRHGHLGRRRHCPFREKCRPVPPRNAGDCGHGRE